MFVLRYILYEKGKGTHCLMCSSMLDGTVSGCFVPLSKKSNNMWFVTIKS